jgi:hypothetical protein
MPEVSFCYAHQAGFAEAAGIPGTEVPAGEGIWGN